MILLLLYQPWKIFSFNVNIFLLVILHLLAVLIWQLLNFWSNIFWFEIGEQTQSFYNVSSLKEVLIPDAVFCIYIVDILFSDILADLIWKIILQNNFGYSEKFNWLNIQETTLIKSNVTSRITIISINITRISTLVFYQCHSTEFYLKKNLNLLQLITIFFLVQLLLKLFYFLL
jgi:hypothetical protein